MKVNVLRNGKGTSAMLVAALISCALIVRLVMLSRFDHVIFLHEADATGYLAMARSIASSFSLNGATHFPPFYPFLCAILSFFTQDLERAGRLAAALSGALLTLPLYWTARQVAGRRVALLAAALSAVCGVFVDFSLQPLSQMPYLLMLMTVTALAVSALSSTAPLLSLALGASCGALYLTRPEGVLAFFCILPLFLIVRHFQRSMPMRRRLVSLACLVAGFALLALPYLVFLHEHTGSWTISGKAGVTILGVDQSMKLLPNGTTLGEQAAGHQGVGALFSDFGSFVATYCTNAANFLRVLTEQFSPWWLAASLCGLFLLALDLRRLPAGERLMGALRLLVLLTGVLVVLPVFAFSNLSVGPSYILPLYPLLFIGLARAAGALEQLLRGKAAVEELPALRRAPIVSVIVFALFGYLSFSPVWKLMSSDEFRDFAASQDFFLKQTGTWLAQHTPPESKVMARWSQMGFYADRPWCGLADGSVEEVVAYLRKNKVAYLVIDSVAVPQRRPRLEPLLYPHPVAGLLPAYGRDESGIRVIIYQVL